MKVEPYVITYNFLDGDSHYLTRTFTTINEKIIPFISYWLPKWTYSNRFYDLLVLDHNVDKTNMVKILNQAISLVNPILSKEKIYHMEPIQLLEKKASYKAMKETIHNLLDALYQLCDWVPISEIEDERPFGCSIKGPSMVQEMTEDEVIALVKEKLGLTIRIKRS